MTPAARPHPDLALAAVDAWPVVVREMTRAGLVCTRADAVAVALAVLSAAVTAGRVVTLDAHSRALAAATAPRPSEPPESAGVGHDTGPPGFVAQRRHRAPAIGHGGQP